MEALQVDSLSKSFGGILALADVSFSLKSGERLAIIGPNGAGKSTLFNIINGQLPATSGKIFFFGQDITGMTVNQRTHLGLGRSFQITNLFPNLSVLKNLMIALQGTKNSRFQIFRSSQSYQCVLDKSRELMESINLWEQRHEMVNTISYGQQRKLEMALCLASEPKLLLLDEPSCGLTAEESADITNRIRNLGKSITVLLVAHDMDLVFGIAERIIILHFGQIITKGTPEEISNDLKVQEIYMGV